MRGKQGGREEGGSERASEEGRAGVRRAGGRRVGGRREGKRGSEGTWEAATETETQCKKELVWGQSGAAVPFKVTENRGKGGQKTGEKVKKTGEEYGRKQ